MDVRACAVCCEAKPVAVFSQEEVKLKIKKCRGCVKQGIVGPLQGSQGSQGRELTKDDEVCTLLLTVDMILLTVGDPCCSDDL